MAVDSALQQILDSLSEPGSFVCPACPRACKMRATAEGRPEGNACARGAYMLKEEIERRLAAVKAAQSSAAVADEAQDRRFHGKVKVAGETLPVVSADPVEKAETFRIMQQLRQLKLATRPESGDVLLELELPLSGLVRILAD